MRTDRVHIVGNLNFWILAGASIFGLGSISIFVVWLHHDVAWYLYVSRRLLEGAKLYTDLIDMNPPLICYLGVPPVWIARLLHLPPIPAFRIYLLGISILGIATCRTTMNQALLSVPVAVRRCLLIVLIFAFLRSWFFGQREHIMFVLVTPYVLASAGRAEKTPFNSRLALFVGVLAGFGMALKPYFLFLWFMVELYLVLIKFGASNWRRPENFGIAVVLSLYYSFVALGEPEYWKQVVPLALKAYHGFNCDISWLLFNPWTKLSAVGFLAFFITRPGPHTRELRRILAISAAAFLLSAFVQYKGFHYHFYPAVATSVILGVVIALDLPGNVKLIGKLASPETIALVIVLALVAISAVKITKADRWNDNPLLCRMAELVQKRAQGEPIVVLSSANFPAFPLVNYTGARWPLRFNALWFLPSLYPAGTSGEQRPIYRSRVDMGKTERFLFDAVVSDLLAMPPGLVIIDLSTIKPGFGKSRFDYIDYLSQDAQFRDLWSTYDYLENVGSYGIFLRRS